MDFNTRLEQAMKATRMSASDLARAVDVVPAAVSGWLADKRPNRKNLEAVAKALNVSASWLTHGEGEAPDVTDDPAQVAAEERHLLWWFRRQGPDGQRVLGEAASSSFDPNIETIAREANQNIRDARRPGERTVRARFDVERLRGSALAEFLRALRFDQLRPHLEAAADGKGKQARVLRQALDRLDERKELILLRIEDTDSIGLIGEEYGEGSYSALVRNVMDTVKEAGAGGSHGLGKSTIQRASAFGIVLFNSNLSEPEVGQTARDGRLVGRISLPWHQTKASPENPTGEWAGPGWYGLPDHSANRAGTARSLYASRALQKSLRLERPARTGATLLVVGAHDPSGETEDPVEIARQIADAAARNFFAALTGRGDSPPIMEITVRVLNVTATDAVAVVREDVVDPSRLMAPFVELLTKGFDLQTVERLTQPGDVAEATVPLRVPRREAEPAHEEVVHEALLLIRLAGDEELEHPYLNTVIMMRGALMKVAALQPRTLGVGARPFFAVLLAGEAAKGGVNDSLAERFLRTAEPPSHESWTVTPEVGACYHARGVKTLLSDFNRAVLAEVKKAVTVPLTEPSDGPRSLRDLLIIRKPSETTQRPRVTAVSGRPREDGAWEISEVTVQFPPRSKGWIFTPLLKFATEVGGGVSVRWAELEAVSDCELIDGDRFAVGPDVRRAKWRGVSLPSSHPTAAADSVALVDIHRISERTDG
jgi:transcriptional regulator with XRE-family HTH domain